METAFQQAGSESLTPERLKSHTVRLPGPLHPYHTDGQREKEIAGERQRQRVKHFSEVFTPYSPPDSCPGVPPPRKSPILQSTCLSPEHRNQRVNPIQYLSQAFTDHCQARQTS